MTQSKLIRGKAGALRSRTYKGRPIPEPEVTVACIVCGREFSVAVSRKEYAKFCTTRCRLKHEAESA